jgi:hypothetical protein
MTLPDPAADDATDPAVIREPRRWRDDGWTAQVIKNEDDDGWAVAMYKAGEAEPALVGPWTMGRDKKNPKPLDTNAFHTLVKTANEVLGRHAQQRHAMLHKEARANTPDGTVLVTLDIVPDDDHPHALLAATHENGEALAQVRVAASFKLDRAIAQAWVDGGFARPG